MSSLVEKAAEGDRRATLEALRDRLAGQIDSTDSGRDVAALGRLLADVLSQLDAIPDAAEVSRADEIAARRAARRAGAAGKARAARG